MHAHTQASMNIHVHSHEHTCTLSQLSSLPESEGEKSRKSGRRLLLRNIRVAESALGRAGTGEQGHKADIPALLSCQKACAAMILMTLKSKDIQVWGQQDGSASGGICHQS